MKKMAKNGFEAKVLTHLEYIKEEQTEHKKTINKLFDKLDNVNNKMTCQLKDCDKRFDKINTEINTAKGYARGAIAVGGIAGGSNLISWIFGWFK